MSAHQFRQDGSHYNGGVVFFGYGYLAIGEPRLKMVRKWYQQGERRGTVEDSFSVDGLPVGSYAEALKKLKAPPTLDAAELSALAAFGDDPIRRPRDLDVEVCLSIRAKGFLAAKDGFFTITEAGKAALPSGEPTPTVAAAKRSGEACADGLAQDEPLPSTHPEREV